jgi:putative transposase
MNENEFVEWCDRLKLSTATREAIQNIRSFDQLHVTAGVKKATTGRYSSKKMGKVIWFESERHKEYIDKLESDSDVLEYYEHITIIYLDYLSRTGRRIYQPYIPDFFVIRTNDAGWEDCKSEMELLSLTKKSPNRWQQEGNWRHLPGEDYAKRLGLSYRVQLGK